MEEASAVMDLRPTVFMEYLCPVFGAQCNEAVHNAARNFVDRLIIGGVQNDTERTVETTPRMITYYGEVNTLVVALHLHLRFIGPLSGAASLPIDVHMKKQRLSLSAGSRVIRGMRQKICAC